ncbi:negative elongation factor E [Exaiptasia diaphana]|uniref:Negative elongation factor E n=1 Tax=Exaiptasia diaphana TaxID=2652724 RepID=A0A913WQQ6_EXADI|nr:negative elongation factor E [Exaiptasia diaphana]KXJ18704.1 Negative elongation factor E [Exaiptasia diaphana]
MVLPKDLTPVEEYLLKKFALLKRKKKALQREKEKAEAAKNVKPGTKRAAPDKVHPPKDAKEIAKQLIASGTVKIKKDNTHREFKRTKSESRKIREGQHGSRPPQSSSHESPENSQRSQVKNLYDSFVPAGRRGSPDSGSRGYHYHGQERKRGKMIFVSGIGLTEKILNTAFNNFGEVERTHFEKEKNHGFVTFDSFEAAEKAIEEMNGLMVSGVHIKVALARRQPYLDEAHSHGRRSQWGSRDGRGGPSDTQHQERRSLVVYDDEI